jgi:phage terminase small subunit
MQTQARHLTPKQRAYIKEYLRNGGNATAAYRAAYNTSASPTRIAHNAHELLRNPKIAPIIAAAEAKAVAATERAADRYAVSRERVVAEYARIAFANAFDYMARVADEYPAVDVAKITRDEAAAISEITVEDAPGGKRVRLKLHDKKAALDSLSKVMGYVVDRKDVRVHSLRDMTTEKLRAMLAELRATTDESDPPGVVIEQTSGGRIRRAIAGHPRSAVRDQSQPLLPPPRRRAPLV